MNPTMSWMNLYRVHIWACSCDQGETSLNHTDTMSKRISTLDSYNLCISTPTVKLEIPIHVITKWDNSNKPIHRPKVYVELKVPTIGPHILGPRTWVPGSPFSLRSKAYELLYQVVIMMMVLKPRVEVYRGINNWQPSIHPSIHTYTCMHAYIHNPIPSPSHGLYEDSMREE